MHFPLSTWNLPVFRKINMIKYLQNSTVSYPKNIPLLQCLIVNFHFLLPSVSHCILKRPHLRINYPSTAMLIQFQPVQLDNRNRPLVPLAPFSLLFNISPFSSNFSFTLSSGCQYERFEHFCKHQQSGKCRCHRNNCDCQHSTVSFPFCRLVCCGIVKRNTLWDVREMCIL